MYTIHNTRQHWCVPSLYCLLPNKKGGTYNKSFGVVQDLVQKGPSIILIDYEVAALNATKEKMNPTQLAGCYFHLGQCVDRKVSELGF